MLKVELHTHTADDPCDPIPHTSEQLIERAAELGYHALAITLHDRQLDTRHLTSFARSRGIVLIPGIERTVNGKHVLLLNFSPAAERVASFADIAQLKRRERGLVIAPHPFFPHRNCLRGLMDRHADLWDAVECNALFARGLDFNEPARRWAARHGLPMVGNGDVHRLLQLGSTYSLVDADPNPSSICEAIAAGQVEVVSRPLSWPVVARIVASLFMPGGTAAPRLSYAAEGS